MKTDNKQLSKVTTEISNSSWSGNGNKSQTEIAVKRRDNGKQSGKKGEQHDRRYTGPLNDCRMTTFKQKT